MNYTNYMKPKPEKTEPKAPRGRPPIPKDERAVVGTIRLKPSHWRKFEDIGGVTRMRRWLDKTKVPASKGPK